MSSAALFLLLVLRHMYACHLEHDILPGESGIGSTLVLTQKGWMS